MSDIKNSHDKTVILTFSQAQKYGVCSSPTTFIEIKRELVKKGFLDPLEPGGLREPSKFILSYRWKQFGTNLFEEIQLIPGVGYKYFQLAWKDEEKRNDLIKSRYPQKEPNTENV